MGTLYVVATPIGNLEDVTLRALRVLGEADAVYAEDTRRTRTLLDRHGVAARPRSLHEHNEAARCAEVLARLGAGEGVALVSDAGTPLVSDPGSRLVAAARAAGHAVVPVPGASAVLAALVASGLPALPFSFLGFPPRKAGERRRLFERLAERPETLVFFESPRRLPATLGELAEALGDREACVARQLTKLHEESVRAPLRALAVHFAEPPRGEVTLVVAGSPGAPAWDDSAVERAVRERVAAGGSPREVATELARLTGRPRRELYARALAARDDA